MTLVAEGKEMTDLRRLETECNTNIKQLPGKADRRSTRDLNSRS